MSRNNRPKSKKKKLQVASVLASKTKGSQPKLLSTSETSSPHSLEWGKWGKWGTGILLGLGVLRGANDWFDLINNILALPEWIAVLIPFLIWIACFVLHRYFHLNKTVALSVAIIIPIAIWGLRILNALTKNSSIPWLQSENPSLKLGTQLIFIACFISGLLWLLLSYTRTHSLLIRLLAFACLALGGGIWGYKAIQEYRDEVNKIVILIAKFDGKKDDEERVTSHIFEAVKNATRDIPRVDVRPLDEIITTEQGSTKAHDKGEAHNAKFVLWGWYDKDLAGVIHIQILKKPNLVIISDDCQRKFVSPSESTQNIEIKQKLSGEMSYLTLLLIGIIQTDSKNYDEGIKVLTQALQYPSVDSILDLSSLYFYRSFAYYSKAQFDLAIDDLSRAIKLRPDFAFYHNRGNIYGETGRVDQAIDDYSQAIKLKPDFVDSYLNRGNIYEKKGLYDLAEADFNQILNLNPKNACACNNLGNVSLSKGNLDTAIAQYSKAIELKPDFAGALSNRGLSYHKKGLLDLAFADLNKSLAIDPNYAGAYSNRAIIFLGERRFDSAIDDSSKAIQLDPKFVENYNVRGDAYREKKLYELAINDYSQGIKLKPDYVNSYINRGNSYRDNGQIDLAFADFDQAIKINPTDAYAYLNRGNVYYDKNQTDPAFADYDKAVQLKPDLANAYYGRGNSYWKKGRLDLALTDYNQAIKLNPSQSHAYHSRGAIYEGKGQLDLALTDYNQSIRLMPDDGEAYYGRGIVYMKMGDTTKAKADFQRYLAMSNDAEKRRQVEIFWRELK